MLCNICREVNVILKVEAVQEDIESICLSMGWIVNVYIEVSH